MVLLWLLSRVNRVRLCATPESAAHQAPPSLEFSRQEYWSGLPLPSLLEYSIAGQFQYVGWSGKSSLGKWHLSQDLE